MDGNRTRLNRIDNPVPYPEDYHGVSWHSVRESNPSLQLERLSSLPIDELSIIWWSLIESNYLPPPHLIMATGLQPAMGNKLLNTLFRMCILKNTKRDLIHQWHKCSGQTKRYLVLFNILDFSHHKRCFIPSTARLLCVYSAEPGPRFLYVHTLRSTITLEQSRAF